MVDLLPPNATRLERNLARAGALIDRVPVPLRDLANPETCPVSALPFLAAAFSVDHWEPTWPVSTKRAVIQAAFAVHKSKGTISALRHTLRHVSAGIHVREWFQSTPPGPRGTFQLELDVLGTGITGPMYDEIDRLVDDAKPVTRHMTGLTINVGLRGSSPIAAAVHLGDTLTVYPRSIELRATGLCKIGGGIHTGDTMTIQTMPAIEIRVRGAARVAAGIHLADVLTLYPRRPLPPD
ncbi:phage tail protein I [Duganella phyllosphaerae]|uniref:Phage tail protein n=1 Tax=Duganella phyllosphaerae TaxID=762836 RepID=A0A1E7WJI6_9BURK|nr:phage tail protein I [Duganella phyllosphaerae]OEZ98769.1 phage tail protein [Duganella phyllosphaerae]